MTTYDQTYGALLQDVIRTALPVDAYLIETPTSGPSTTTVTFANHLNLWPSSHWVGGEVRASVSGSPQVRRIASFAPTTGVVTFTSAFSADPADQTVEMLRAGLTFGQVTSAINAAFRKIGNWYLVDDTDTSNAYQPGRSEYAVPTDWRSVHRVEFDHSVYERSDVRYSAAQTSTTTERGLFDAAARTRLGQLFRIEARPFWASVFWLKLRAVGSPAGTLTGRLQTLSSSLPSGTTITNGSATYAATSVSADQLWVPFVPSAPALLAPDTSYALTLETSASVDASNYVAWEVDTAAAFAGGTEVAYNGSAWSAGTGVLSFLLQGEPHWRPEDNPRRWDVVRSTTPVLFARPAIDHLDGTPIRLHGQAIPSLPSADSTTLEIHPALIRAVAAAELAMMAANSREDLQRAAMLAEMADRAMQQFRVGLRSEGRPVRF